MLARPSGHNHGPAPGATHVAAAGAARRPVRGGGASGEVVNLPNAITFARLCAVPFAVWLVLEGRFGWAAALFAAAGASDALDGFLARRRGGTALGAVLDPLADKALLVCMFVTLSAIGVLPQWLALLVVLRDLAVTGGIVVLSGLGRRPRIRPLFVGKLNTAAQIVLVALALLLSAAGGAAPAVPVVLSWIVAATTLASGVAYAVRAARAA